MTNEGNGAIMRELGISKQAYDFVRSAENSIKPVFEMIDANAEVNLARVLAGFRKENVGLRHFAPTTGYGYDDAGRDTLDRLFAHALFAEDALVRPQLTSGTHALYLALSGLCQMGDAVVAASGKPYDTLENAIGLSGDHPHSLKKQGVSFDYVDLNDDGSINIDGVLNMVAQKKAAVLYVQRSRGYAWRDSLLVNEHMAPLFRAVKERFPNVAIFVDNCYGEFTDVVEPLCAGADIIAGSLIKNPGGGIAPTGGYIAGKAKYIQRIENLLTVPGMGREVGSYAASYRPFYQGLYMAPHTTAQALKGAALFARVFEMLGMETMPSSNAKRSDIVQAVRFEEAEGLISFCRSIQSASPVDSAAVPEPWDMPGYTSQVIMAAGAFVQGSSIELSADAPIRKPYTAYVQGGLTYEHCSLAAMLVLTDLIKKGIAKL